MSDDMKISTELTDSFLERAYPEWMRPTKDDKNFSAYVLKSHSVIENLINNLLVVFFFNDPESDLALSFRNVIVVEIDFAKKVNALVKLEIIDKKKKSSIYKVNDYRKAQAHIREDNPLRTPDINNFSNISKEALSTLAVSLVRYDRKVAKQAVIDMNKHFEKTGVEKRVTVKDLMRR